MPFLQLAARGALAHAVCVWRGRLVRGGRAVREACVIALRARGGCACGVRLARAASAWGRAVVCVVRGARG